MGWVMDKVKLTDICAADAGWVHVTRRGFGATYGKSEIQTPFFAGQIRQGTAIYYRAAIGTNMVDSVHHVVLVVDERVVFVLRAGASGGRTKHLVRVTGV